ncbi:MAG: nucleotide exchange factor GrpE [Prevotellaceae bacterium]|nr:nucleotide exchange factor GrpE [Prevotellaceae bacterium]
MEENKNIQEEEIKQDAEKTAEEAAAQAENSENTENSENVENTENAEASEKDPLEEANRQIEELKDKYLRSVAEFDNYRKRTLKEKAELILNGGEKAISAMLPVIDDMERAIENGGKTDDPQVLREGMDLIYSKMMKVLETLGVKPIETENADFDTDVHEAIAMVPGMGDDKKGKVLDCVMRGYKLNDKVIRHAKVAVGQ